MGLLTYTFYKKNNEKKNDIIVYSIYQGKFAIYLKCDQVYVNYFTNSDNYVLLYVWPLIADQLKIPFKS